MLTGRVPFDADTPVSVALMQVQEEPIEPRKLNPQIPISVNNIILKAMQKDPADRYQNATEMLIDLSTALKRPDDDFVKLNKKFDTLQTQKLSTLYDIDSKVRKDDEEDEEEEYRPKRKKKRGFFGFMKDHVLISFILIAILLFGLALGGTILVMNLTKSKDVQIPNLVKNSAGTRLTEAQAVEIYNKTEFKKKNDLKIEYVEDETINGETVEPGQVVKQTPAYVENRKIKAKDQITIYVRKAKEVKTLKMIDLTGKTKEEAESLLKSLGYTGTIKYEEEASDSLKEGLIIRQSIQKDIEFKEDADLTITVSSGSDKIDVPNVLGQTEAAARQALEAAGFAVKVETTENSDKSNGIVLKQNITDKAKAGDTITITVNKLPELKKGTVTANIKTLSGYTPKLDEEVKEIAPESVKVEIKAGKDDSSLDTVYSKSISPATESISAQISGIGTITVKVYIDGVLKGTKQIDLNSTTTLSF